MISRSGSVKNSSRSFSGMRFLENKLVFFVLFITLPLLFLPKINLISIGNETAGLRFDDLVLFVIGFLLMFSHIVSDKKFYKVEGWIFLITLFSLVSFISNRFLVGLDILHMDAKIFYTVRLLEYFMFFYVGSMASRYIEGRVIIGVFFTWNFVLMLLQKLSLVGAVTVVGYDGDVSSRVQGIASFPSEMGLLLNLLFCYMIFDKTPSRVIRMIQSPAIRWFLRKSYIYWMFFLFAILVILTGNRISIVALIVCFAFRLKEEVNFRSIGSLLTVAIIVPLSLLAMGSLIINTAAIYQRSAGLFSFRNLELAELVWEKIDLKQNPVGNEVISVSDYDASWWMRIHKWVHVMKAYVSNPAVYLQGLGPGFAWAALDGGLLRIFVENGIIGALLYWKFFSSIYRINLQMKWMSIAFLFNMIFFDAYLAYKTMSFFLFAAGHSFETEGRAHEKYLGDPSSGSRVMGSEPFLKMERV